MHERACQRPIRRFLAISAPWTRRCIALIQAEGWNLVTEGGRLDIAWVLAGTRGYSDVVREAISYDLEGVLVRAASLADVIRSKEAVGRERDRAALPTLRLLLERLEREQS